MYVLDTNVVSELRRPRPHGGVIAWISGLQPAELNIAGVTIGEIQIAIERTREPDAAKAAEIESWLIDLMKSVTVVPMTGDTFRIWARYMHRKPAHISGDAMIAATATQHGLTIATRNVRDFEQFPVSLLNPFENPG
jgi:predicted nucleic acid-binding protein